MKEIIDKAKIKKKSDAKKIKDLRKTIDGLRSSICDISNRKSDLEEIKESHKWLKNYIYDHLEKRDTFQERVQSLMIDCNNSWERLIGLQRAILTNTDILLCRELINEGDTSKRLRDLLGVGEKQ